MISWKVVVGSGAVAVVLSLLTGIISGVSFGTLMLRAVMWGALFCGAGAGVSYVISKYLPELQSLPKKPEGKAEEARPKVDIVLPDENPHAGSEEEDESYGLFEEADAPPRQSGGEGPREQSAGEDSDGATMVEEVEETHHDRGASSRSGTAEELPDLEDGEEGGPAGPQGGFQSQGLSDITSVSGRGSTIDVMGHEADTEEIARAIRTALKKDQKG